MPALKKVAGLSPFQTFDSWFRLRALGGFSAAHVCVNGRTMDVIRVHWLKITVSLRHLDFPAFFTYPSHNTRCTNVCHFDGNSLLGSIPSVVDDRLMDLLILFTPFATPVRSKR